MAKRLNLFILIMLVVSQTILGPLVSTSAVLAEGNGNDDEGKTEEVDKEKLEKLLEDVADLKEEDYSVESFEALKKVVENAEEVFENNEVTQDDVDEAVEAVEDAVEELGVDKTDLTTLIEKNADKEEADYEADSFADFVAALTAGEKVVEDPDATQEVVNDTETEVEKALDALKETTTDDGEKSGDDDEEGYKDEDGTELEEEDTDKKPQNQPMSAPIQPFAGSEDGYEDEIELDDSHILGFTFKVNGETFTGSETIEEVSNEDEFELKIDLVDPLNFNELNYGPGTKLKYPLPNGFSDHFTYSDNLGPLSTYGNVNIEGDYVVITLTDGVMDEGSGLPFDIGEGTFEIKGNFSDDNADWSKKIDMPGGEKFTVNFVPKENEGVTINKENGKPNKDGKKSDEIEWKVTVNTDLANESDNPVFTDTLSASATGHKYDKDSVEIREIDVKPNGDTTVGDIASDITIDNSNFTEDDTKFEVELKKGKAYEITYTTIPDNPGINESVTYFNTADYDGDDQFSGTPSVDFGKAIEKSASSVDAKTQQTEWIITYNGNEQLIEKDTKMSDKWTTELSDGSTQTAEQKLVDGAGGVTVEGLDSSKYTVNYDSSEQGFNIVFNENFSDTIIIKYKTEPVADLKGSENFTVTNEAKHGQIDTSDKKTVEYNTTDLTLNKSNVDGLDYNTKTMKWKITANQAGYQMDAGATFEDTFTNKNMILDENAEFKVTIGGQPATEGDSADYILTDKGTDGFTVKLNAATDEEVVIEYTTSFDQIKDVDEDRSQDYYNDVVLKNSGLPGEPEDAASINSNPQQKNNGSKDGSYNYETKEFTWTIIFNYNSNTLNEAVLKDVLPEEHEITGATLEKGSINSGGTFVADSDQSGVTDPSSIEGSHSFALSLGEIKEPYKLVYTTKMKDDVLPVDDENDDNYSVENEAELFDGDTPEPNSKWDKKVTVNHSKTVLDKKNGKQINNSDLIEWDFLYNTAQSKLENVKITDTFADDPNLNAPNQLLDEASLKVYKVTYNASGSMTKKGQELTAGEDYDVSFNTDGATFILEFEELTHGIYVEYESVFIGLKDSPIANELSVTYNDGEDKDGSSDVPNLNFTYGAFATTTSGEFVVVKIDEATGEPMDGVEFTLKRGDRDIRTGKTDENGILDFGLPFATGKYQLVEDTPDDYEPLNDFEFQLTADGGPYEGKQVVNVTNTPSEFKDKMCDEFTVTVKDVNDDPVGEGKTIKLVNKKTGEEFEQDTNDKGQIVKDREDLPAGDYDVYEVDGDDDIYLDDIEVKYVDENNDDCNATVQPKVTTVSIEKVWNDDNATERPDDIEIVVSRQVEGSNDKEEVETITVEATDGWEFSKNYRAQDNDGKDYTYSVKEKEVTGYASNVTGNEDDGFTVTNTRTGTTEVSVAKVWEGPKTDSVTINLLAGGETVDGQSIELSETNSWTHTFENLPKYDSEGVEIEYTVKEDEVDGYNTEITEDTNGEFTVTNTQKTYAIGDYVWVDYNSDGKQNESDKAALKEVTVELYEKDNDKPIKTTKTDEEGLYIFDELLAGEYQVKFILTDDQAKKYKFTKQNQGDATEDSDADKEGWTTVIKLDDDNKQLIDSYTDQTVKATEGIDPTWDAGVIELTEVTVDKIWKDEKESDRPENIKVNLKQDGTVIDTETIKANDDGEWTHTFTGLTKYLGEGTEYEYTVSEQEVPGYAVSYDQEKLEITNTRADTKDIEITKSWLDNDDATGDRPDKIEVELFRSIDGDAQPTKVDTYTVKAEDDWSLEIDELPVFDADGKAYTYEIDEIEVDGYEYTVAGFDITNLRVGETEVSGEKTWDHKDAKDRPEEITVNLLQNGKEIDSQDVTADDNWTYEFTDLAEFDKKGAAYTYEVEEDDVAEYNSAKDEESYDIENTRKTYAIGDYTWIDRNKDGIQDENEPVLPGVKVELIDENGDVIAEKETDENGRYIFDELVSGDYQVKFTLTEEQEKKYKFTTRNADDSDATNDSDADSNGYTAQFTLDENNEYLTLDEDYEYQDVKASEGIDPTWDAGVIELTEVSGEKTWVNNHNESEELPESITVNLVVDEEVIDSQKVTEEDDWTYIFEGLDKYDENGEKITYSVTEDAVDGYETSYDGNNITNTKVCESFTVEVEDENGDPVTEEEYTFESEDGEKITKKTDKDGKVTFDREDLPEGKYTVKDKDGNKIGEIDVEYNVNCEDNITKVILPVEPEDPKTCEEIEITVKEDGKPSKEKEYTLTSADGKTKVTFTTDNDGKASIDRDKLPNGKYTVTDEDGNVVGTVEITVSCEVELNIKPTKETTEPTKPEGKEDGTTPSKPSEEDKGGLGGFLPKTATNTFNLLLAGALLLVAGTGFVVFRRRNVE